jgi:hypothetical protein
LFEYKRYLGHFNSHLFKTTLLIVNQSIKRLTTMAAATVASSAAAIMTNSSSPLQTVFNTVNSVLDSPYLPLRVLGKRVFLASWLFYVVIGIGARIVAQKIWTRDNEEEANEKGFISENRKRETFGRWTPSLIHATLASVMATIAGLGLMSTDIISNEDVIMHSLGYFIGDLVVDRDPEYFAHHVGPLLHCECMLRLGALFWHTMRAGWIMEYGNVVAHSAALITWRKGKTWHLINTWSFWISRPLSYYDGFMAWYRDIPEEKRWTLLGIIPLIGILGVYYSNTKWMIKMCRTRPPKKTGKKVVVPDDKSLTTPPTTTNGHSTETASTNGHVKTA